VGNLEDLEYIEKKRKQIYGEHLNERNLAFLVDRFKFMNLYPCSENEMKLLGFNDSSDADVYNELGTNAALKNVSLAANVTTIDKENEADELNSSKNVEIANSINPFVSSSIKRAKYPVPDMKKMLPFKPIQNAFIDLQPVPGGGMFLFPSIFAEMIKRLPPPNYFDVIFFFSFTLFII
jgi:cleavage stimulation factor subunit 3